MEIHMMFHPTLTIRTTAGSALDGLAHRAGAAGAAVAERPRGRALVAERNGLPVAAISLTSGVVLTDAGAFTTDAVHLLRYLRYRLLRQSGQRGALQSLLRRPAPQILVGSYARGA
jgi:hypothetical protein